MINSFKHSDYLKQDLIKNDSAMKKDSKEQMLRSLLNLLRAVPATERAAKAAVLAQANSKATWIKRVLLDTQFREYLIDLLEYEGFAQIPINTFNEWDTACTGVSRNPQSNSQILVILHIGCYSFHSSSS